MGQASAYLSAGRAADAEAAYNALLRDDPVEHRAHLGLADCAAARGLSDWGVDHLVEHARAYAELQHMRGAFALMTKALAIAPGRLDLHIDVAEFEALEGRTEMAALRLENLARTYVALGQEEDAELVLEAAAAFRTATPPMVELDDADVEEVLDLTPATLTPTPTPTPSAVMVRPSPLVPPLAPEPKAKPKRSSRGRPSGHAPKWRPSTVTQDPPPRAKKAAAKAPAPRLSINPPPRPRKAASPIGSYKKERPSLVVAPSPKRGGSKLDALPHLHGPSLAARLRQASASSGALVGEDDRTSLWRPTT